MDALSRLPNEERKDIEQATLLVNKSDIDMGVCLFGMQLLDDKLQEIVRQSHLKVKEMKKNYVVETVSYTGLFMERKYGRFQNLSATE